MVKTGFFSLILLILSTIGAQESEDRFYQIPLEQGNGVDWQSSTTELKDLVIWHESQGLDWKTNWGVWGLGLNRDAPQKQNWALAMALQIAHLQIMGSASPQPRSALVEWDESWQQLSFWSMGQYQDRSELSAPLYLNSIPQWTQELGANVNMGSKMDLQLSGNLAELPQAKSTSLWSQHLLTLDTWIWGSNRGSNYWSKAKALGTAPWIQDGLCLQSSIQGQWWQEQEHFEPLFTLNWAKELGNTHSSLRIWESRTNTSTAQWITGGDLSLLWTWNHLIWELNTGVQKDPITGEMDGWNFAIQFRKIWF